MNELSFDPETLELPSGHFINGEIRRSGKSSIDVACPSNGRRLGQISNADEALIDEAVNRRTPRSAKQRLGQLSASRARARAAPLGRTSSMATQFAWRNWRPLARRGLSSTLIADDVPFTAEAIRFFGETRRQARRRCRRDIAR